MVDRTAARDHTIVSSLGTGTPRSEARSLFSAAALMATPYLE
jgi:hypothetical protein